jgi:hypothetical protein
MWSFCLTTTAPPFARHVVQLPADKATVSDLYEAAQGLFFPATISQLQQAAGGRAVLPLSQTTSLAQVGLQSQDRILVTLSSATLPLTTMSSSATSTLTKKQKIAASPKRVGSEKNGSESPTVVATPSTKRQAAVKATASFADVIRQQDELMRQEAEATAASKRKKQAAAAASSPVRRTQSARTKTSSSAPKAFASTTGRRLHDGTTIGPARKKQHRESHQDPALALLEAVGGSSNDRDSRLIRRGWKQAVQDAAERSKAVARLAAVAAGRFHITVAYADSNKSSCSSPHDHPIRHEEEDKIVKCQIRFPKGVQGRGDYVDENVDILTEAVLQSVVAAIYPVNPEALRPENLALLSPRFFWSIVHYLQQQQSLQQPQEHVARSAVDIGLGLQQLQPDLDWSFLKRRRQLLSAKALENLRQQEQQQTTVTTDGDWQAAAHAIEAVEQAMGNLQTLERRQKQSRLLSAAMDRSSRFVVLTPTETDLDELRECCSQGCDSALSDTTIEAFAQTLVKKCGVHNWRELANCNAHVLLDALQKYLDDDVDKSMVQAWIDHAQLNSLDEIVVEICQGNTIAVEVLRDGAHSGTPKDLAAWRGIADSLHYELATSVSSGAVITDVSSLPSKGALAQWCDRAHEALNQLEWLNLYVTPIEE